MPFFDLVPVGVDDGFVPLLLLEPALPLLLLLLLLAWLAQGELRQHLHTRDFLPDDVSELSSVAAVEDADGADAGGGAIVLVVVVVVVRIGCRQQDEEDTDVDVVAVTVAAAAAASSVVAFDAAEDADVTVFVDSFVPVPCTAVFNIFSSPSPTGPCRAAANAHLGHSPTLNGCSSLL